MTVNHSKINNNVLPCLPSYEMFMGGNYSMQTNLPVPTTYDIANTACISLDAYIDHVLGHGISITFAYSGIEWIRAMLDGGQQHTS